MNRRQVNYNFILRHRKTNNKLEANILLMKAGERIV